MDWANAQMEFHALRLTLNEFKATYPRLKNVNILYKCMCHFSNAGSISFDNPRDPYVHTYFIFPVILTKYSMKQRNPY